MNLIIVSDVFGITPALLEISNRLGGCSIVDPYQSQMMEFTSEAEAYSYFVETVGLDNYSSGLLNIIESIKDEITLIGFSVGSTAIWKMSESINNKLIKQAFCFYGSQIRHFTNIDPIFKINLIFPKSEPHFDVLELQNDLVNKVNVETRKVEYLHGFMNYYSSNYNEAGYKIFMEFLRLTAS